jgi:hypothetical protein
MKMLQPWVRQADTAPPRRAASAVSALALGLILTPSSRPLPRGACHAPPGDGNVRPTPTVWAVGSFIQHPVYPIARVAGLPHEQVGGWMVN